MPGKKETMRFMCIRLFCTSFVLKVCQKKAPSYPTKLTMKSIRSLVQRCSVVA